MSNGYDWDDEEDAASGGNAMKELRDAYKKASKQNKELMDQLTDLQKQIRTRSVKDVLESKGLPAKIAAFIPETVTTSDEVEAWVAEYGDVFGVQQPAEGEATAAPAAFDPALAALNRIAATQQTGQPLSSDPDQLSARINAAQTPEELTKLIFGSAGGPVAY